MNYLLGKAALSQLCGVLVSQPWQHYPRKVGYVSGDGVRRLTILLANSK